MIKFRKFATSALHHLREEIPCQDYSGVLEFDNVQAIAVADGHGGADYFRSEVGSQLAVAVAFEQIKIFCANIKDGEIFSDGGIRNFKFSLKNAWIDAVKNHWLKNPVDENSPRWQEVSSACKAQFKTDENFIPVAYGTTLICAVSIGSQILIVQIGDGSCAALFNNGEFKLPVPPAAENFLNVTTSLCDEEADKKFRHAVLDCESPLAPIAIFLSTDGLDNCYPIYQNARYLYNLYSNVIIDSMIRNGFEATEAEITESFLSGMSARSSCDDVSLAYLIVNDTTLLGKILLQKGNLHENLLA